MLGLYVSPLHRGMTTASCNENVAWNVFSVLQVAQVGLRAAIDAILVTWQVLAIPHYPEEVLNHWPTSSRYLFLFWLLLCH